MFDWIDWYGSSGTWIILFIFFVGGGALVIFISEMTDPQGDQDYKGAIKAGASLGFRILIALFILIFVLLLFGGDI